MDSPLDNGNSVNRTRSLPTKQLIAALMGPGLFMLALDSAISHFAGKDGVDNQLQVVPVLFGVVGGVALLVLGIRALGFSAKLVRLFLRVVGGLGVVVGSVGTLLHLIPLYKDLSDEKLTWAAFEGAISLSPPVFAPLSFAGLGALLVVLSWQRLSVDLLKTPQIEEQLSPVASLEASRQRTG